MVRVAVLDDYWRVAEELADWDSLAGADVDFYYDTLLDIDALVDRLAPYEAIVTTRERTRFPREVLSRLPNLKLIAAPVVVRPTWIRLWQQNWGSLSASPAAAPVAGTPQQNSSGHWCWA